MAVSFKQTLEGSLFDGYNGQVDRQPSAVLADYWMADPAMFLPGANKAVNDVALVHLVPSPVTEMAKFAALPPEDADGALVHGQVLTAVGYGRDSWQPPGTAPPGPVPVATWTGSRQSAVGVFNGLTPGFLDAYYDGSTGAPCAGDSGARYSDRAQP